VAGPSAPARLALCQVDTTVIATMYTGSEGLSQIENLMPATNIQPQNTNPQTTLQTTSMIVPSLSDCRCRIHHSSMMAKNGRSKESATGAYTTSQLRALPRKEGILS